MTAMDGKGIVVCGVRVDATDARGAAERIVALGSSRTPAVVHLCNAWVLALASRDDAYAGILNHGDLNVPDGAPVAWLGRRLGLSMERVPGTELVLEVVRRGRENGLRHYLYGSHPDIVHGVADELTGRFQGAHIVGSESPPFRPLTPNEEDELEERMRRLAPHIVWVGLGTPRQDEFVERFRDRIGAVLVPVGAAFDFLAGEQRRAPRWMQRISLEWLHRLASEPRRLWRRYLVGNVVFLLAVLKDPPVIVVDESER